MVVAVAAAGYFGFPIVSLALNTVSTDDAYVNGHVTFTAPRVPGQVMTVLVDDNYRVRKGQLLVTLDKIPYQIIVDEKQAAYGVAKANLVVAQDEFRGLIGKARSARFQLQHAIEDVDNQVALLRSNVAKLAKADADYKRAINLQKTPGVISQQDVDQYKAAYLVALEQVYQTRVGLGLPMKPENGDLTDVPKNLDQTYSTVRAAVANLYQAGGVAGNLAQILRLHAPRAYRRVLQPRPQPQRGCHLRAPDRKRTLDQAGRGQRAAGPRRPGPGQAELELLQRLCRDRRRGHEPQRQSRRQRDRGPQLMAVRSLTEIWIDANFKETQLRNLRIGQPAVLDVDMYGSHKTFKGHITGFTMGTGSTLALLPPENATGNFVKIVQRLPVRIELDRDSMTRTKLRCSSASR